MKLRLAMAASFFAMGFNAYLTWHYYPLKYGAVSEQSFCNINDALNCDAVSASQYSAIFDIPLSLWGLLTYFVLFLLISGFRFKFVENYQRMGRFALALSGFTLLTSLAMAAISSFIIGTYCLFCIGIYLCSILVFEMLRRAQDEPFLSHFVGDLKSLGGESKGTIAMFACIPLFAVVANNALVQDYGAQDLQLIIRQSIGEWQANNKYEFNLDPTLSTGANKDKAVITISEFADFRCGHCKQAAPSLHAFAKANPDVHFQFFVFPLDGECNDAISAASGLSCRLAKATLCANQQNKGWPMHDAIFAEQDYFQRTSIKSMDEKLQQYSNNNGIDWNLLKTCMSDQKTEDTIRAQARLGENSKVEGTPTIYADGKKLPRGQLIPVLDAARKTKL